MRRTSLAIAALLAVAVIAVSCTDRPPTAPSTQLRPFAKSANITPGTCTTIDNLIALATTVFGAGSPNLSSAVGKLNTIAKDLKDKDVKDAQEHARELIRFIQKKANELPGKAQIPILISGIECFVGISTDTFLVYPSDQPQTIVNSTGQAGLLLPANPVTVPTLITVTVLPAGSASPLITKLDQYPGYVQVTQESSVGNSLTGAVTVAVCAASGIPADVRARLRLGHQGAGGFEITPYVDVSSFPLNCSGVVSAERRLPGWVRSLANLVLPKPLYARMQFSSGGVGGSASEFSPFGPVDPVLSFSGGVGGSASEFLRAPATTDTAASSGITKPADTRKRTSGAARSATSGITVMSTVDCFNAVIGTEQPAECRPMVTLKTRLGATVMQNVPVDWAITAGDGVTANDNPFGVSPDCGTFGTAASSTTNATGDARACWTLGQLPGTNTVVATPKNGGDAIPGVTFSPATISFSATALAITPTATAVGGTFPFDNLVHAGTGTCSNGLAPVYSYSGGSAPTNVGSWVLTVTCGAGNPQYTTATATANIVIGLVVPVVNVSCPPTTVYTGSPLTPCTATATAPGLSTTPTPEYAANTDVGSATATVNLAASGNYGAATGSATFPITAAPTTTSVTCSALTFTYTGVALTPCTATVTGPGSLSLTPPPDYAANTNVGQATATVNYAGGGNYLPSTDFKNFQITPAVTAATLSCPASVTFTGAALTPCTAQVTGPGGLNEPLAPSYSNNVNVGLAGATATYAATPNYQTVTATPASFQITPAGTVVSISCASTAYTGATLSPCSATVAGPLLSQTVPVVYSANPLNAADYTATATFAAGGNYAGSSASGAFSISKLAATATAGSGSRLFAAANPTLPCAVTGLLATQSGVVSCTTSIPPTPVAGTYATTPLINPPIPANYNVGTVNGTLTVIGYVQQGCFASPINNSVTPPVMTGTTKGSNITVKCRLVEPSGRPINTAKGNLLVQDMGTTGLVAPPDIPAFSKINAFTTHIDTDYDDDDGYYVYNLSTSPTAFIKGHYYLVTATWNDGSTTKGWIYIKP